MKRICNHWTEGEVEYLKDNYLDINPDLLILNLNRTWNSIRAKGNSIGLKRNGLFVDEDFFKNWTKEMAWTFGFWIADGNMSKNNYIISFASKDYDLLETINSNLKSEYKIGKLGNGFQLQICNKILYNDLLNLGGTPRKSLTIQFPEVPDKILPDFIRGYLDGDGCNYIQKVGKYRYLGSSFVGNIDFLTGLKDKIKEQIDLDPTGLYSNKNYNPRTKHLDYNGKKAIALGDYIYQDSENLRLERKFDIYDDMKKEYNLKLEKRY